MNTSATWDLRNPTWLLDFNQCRKPAMTSAQHLIDPWFWLPRALPWQGLSLEELQSSLQGCPGRDQAK